MRKNFCCKAGEFYGGNQYGETLKMRLRVFPELIRELPLEQKKSGDTFIS
jgi:hypothetical protein